MAIARPLAQHVAGLDWKQIPSDVQVRAAELVLDLWGNMVRARHDAHSTPAIVATLHDLGLADGRASVVSDPDGYAPYGAALLNGATAHSLDFDDTHAPGSIHPGATVIPAALAAAEMSGADGSTFLTAIVAGYDVTCRLSMALGPSKQYARGFHPTATCGVYGAAAAAGRVFGLSPDQITSAFGLAGSQAAGSLQFLANGGWNKRWQAGASAANGLAAALAAKNGFLGAAEPFTGRHGMFAGYTDDGDPAIAAKDLGSRFDLIETGMKPYPSCRYTHAALDGVRELVAKHGLKADDIRAIRIGLPRTGIAITAVPQDVKRRARTVVDGQFSMHFVAAVGVLAGGLAWDDYAHWLSNPDVDALCDRIDVWNDPKVEAAYPEQMAGSVEIRTAAGTLSTFVGVPSGEPGRFPDRAGQRDKFSGLVAPYLDRADVDKLADAIMDLGAAKDIAPLFALSQPRRRAAA